MSSTSREGNGRVAGGCGRWMWKMDDVRSSYRDERRGWSLKFRRRFHLIP